MSTETKHAAPKVEAWCIGALLDADGPVLRTDARSLLASSGLTAADFTNPELRAYFGAIVALAERGRPAEASTVAATARGLPGVPEGAYQRLESLRGGNTANRQAFYAHTEEVRRLGHLRKLEAFHRGQLAALEVPRADPAKLATSLETFVHSFAGDTQPDETGESDIIELMEDWQASNEGIRQPVMPTGVHVLDEHMKGWVNNLNVVGGLPSVGKSALIGEAIYNQLRAGYRVGVFGLEDGTKWIPKRHMSRVLGIPVGDVTRIRLHPTQLEQMQIAAGEFSNLSRNLLVYRRAGINPEALVQRCRHWVLNQGVQVIYIDHGGEVQHTSGAAKERHDLAVAGTYAALRNLAVNHRVPVVVLCHFNRETGDRGRPTQRSFAESAYIERMARVALGLWDVEDRPRELRCTILKATEGKKNVDLWLARDSDHALVSSLGGGVLDLRAEADAEREQQRATRAPKRDWRAAQ